MNRNQLHTKFKILSLAFITLTQVWGCASMGVNPCSYVQSRTSSPSTPSNNDAKGAAGAVALGFLIGELMPECRHGYREKRYDPQRSHPDRVSPSEQLDISNREDQNRK